MSLVASKGEKLVVVMSVLIMGSSPIKGVNTCFSGE
jgi:hypothetical protein